MIKLNFLNIIALLFLAACQSTPTRAPEEIVTLIAPADKTPSFRLVDERPQGERMRRSEDTRSFDGPTIILGDANLAPEPMAVLRNSLQDKLGDKLNGKTISIDKFEVAETYLTNARQQGNGGGGVTGSVGGVIGSGGRGGLSIGLGFPLLMSAMQNVDSRVEGVIRGKVDGVAFEARNSLTAAARYREDTIRQVVSGLMANTITKLETTK
jgi:hypothetical protein